MRPFEVALLVANVPVLLWPFFSTRDRPPWGRFLPFLAALFSVSHFLFEGYRWQMIPAYALCLVLLIAALRWRQLGLSTSLVLTRSSTLTPWPFSSSI